ncbi:28S ribosomal protein S35, mitochondrial [Armadillidium vulgare]|nr:28S ribosomal protein S35, mitochondrial [Armadillidium vulgare]
MRFLLNLSTCKMLLQGSSRNISVCTRCSSTNSELKLDVDELSEEKFKVLELVKKRTAAKKHFGKTLEKFFKQPRVQVQSVTQDWGSVWPGPRSFHPASVPLPIRMGYPKRNEPSPDKWGNAELMKIPNFLHLTPPVIERQCKAIKKFCTPWPKELESEEAQNYFYPLVVKTSSYLHSSASLRDPRARSVSITVSLDSLKLDWHGCDKLLRLVGERFDPITRLITITADRCPLSQQNLDYCIYLLTVIYNESKKTEPWEHEKGEFDYEYFDFDRSKSKETVEKLQEFTGEILPEEKIESYSNAVVAIHNEDENEETLENYKNAVLKILKLK